MFRLSYNTWRRGLFRLCVLRHFTVLPSPVLIHLTATMRTTAGPSSAPRSHHGYFKLSTLPLFVSLHWRIRRPLPHSILSCHTKHPLAPYSHPHVGRSDPPDSLDAHRWHLGTDRVLASRVGVHSGQPTVRVPRMEARDVRRTCALARRAPRMDQGRRCAWVLHPRSLGLEPTPELFR